MLINCSPFYFIVCRRPVSLLQNVNTGLFYSALSNTCGELLHTNAQLRDGIHQRFRWYTSEPASPPQIFSDLSVMVRAGQKRKFFPPTGEKALIQSFQLGNNCSVGTYKKINYMKNSTFPYLYSFPTFTSGKQKEKMKNIPLTHSSTFCFPNWESQSVTVCYFLIDFVLSAPLFSWGKKEKPTVARKFSHFLWGVGREGNKKLELKQISWRGENVKN